MHFRIKPNNETFKRPNLTKSNTLVRKEKGVTKKLTENEKNIYTQPKIERVDNLFQTVDFQRTFLIGGTSRSLVTCDVTVRCDWFTWEVVDVTAVQ